MQGQHETAADLIAQLSVGLDPVPDLTDFDREREKLRAKIGELTIDVDFLREKSKQLGL